MMAHLGGLFQGRWRSCRGCRSALLARAPTITAVGFATQRVGQAMMTTAIGSVRQRSGWRRRSSTRRTECRGTANTTVAATSHCAARRPGAAPGLWNSAPPARASRSARVPCPHRPWWPIAGNAEVFLTVARMTSRSGLLLDRHARGRSSIHAAVDDGADLDRVVAGVGSRPYHRSALRMSAPRILAISG